jgi:hypothetical protein
MAFKVPDFFYRCSGDFLCDCVTREQFLSGKYDPWEPLE